MMEQDEGLVIEQEGIFAAQRLLKKRVRLGCDEYLVKWQGYASKYNTWEPECNILDKRLFDHFHARRKRKLKRKVARKDERSSFDSRKIFNADGFGAGKHNMKTHGNEKVERRDGSVMIPGDVSTDDEKATQETLYEGVHDEVSTPCSDLGESKQESKQECSAESSRTLTSFTINDILGRCDESTKCSDSSNHHDGVISAKNEGVKSSAPTCENNHFFAPGHWYPQPPNPLYIYQYNSTIPSYGYTLIPFDTGYHAPLTPPMTSWCTNFDQFLTNDYVTSNYITSNYVTGISDGSLVDSATRVKNSGYQ